MIEFYINNSKADIQLDSEKTIGDVLTSFEKNCEENNAAVIGIKINNKTITADIFDEESKKEITDNTKFEFEVVTEQIIKTSFLQLSSLFETLSQTMQSLPVEILNGKMSTVSNSIQDLADSIDTLCHVATLASLFPETFNKNFIDGKSFSEFFEDFSPILSDFEDALKNNDTVTIGDLAEFEICPRLTSISKSLKCFAE
jgi:hypothetical protein